MSAFCEPKGPGPVQTAQVVPPQINNPKSRIENGKWLPDMDLNHDKQIQSLLCYRYTIGQTGAFQGRFFAAGVKRRYGNVA